ncbi:MAG: hypothetical protein K0R02_201 [Rickettsiaceae bacterium]|jgi:hypothetical protein|nr:hypothetical protein [Rickettsiaceae bacterium]
MTKFTKAVKSFFLKCYSNAEDTGVVKSVENLTIVGMKIGVDVLDATVLNIPDPVEKVMKAGLEVGIKTGFENLDDFIDAENAKMKSETNVKLNTTNPNIASSYQISNSPLGGDSVADNSSIPSISVMGNTSDIIIG